MASGLSIYNEPTRFAATLAARGVGFAPHFAFLSEVLSQTQDQKYPPYNLRAINQDEYIIELALAGFTKDNLSVVLKDQVLIISGEGLNSTFSNSEFDYVHQGIARRDFEQSFPLAEHVIVDNAEFKDGLLTITLKRELPEELKPKTIKIK
jgi:molecular chaperone IbpA